MHDVPSQLDWIAVYSPLEPPSLLTRDAGFRSKKRRGGVSYAILPPCPATSMRTKAAGEIHAFNVPATFLHGREGHKALTLTSKRYQGAL